jgi:hypothetical protein
MVRRHGQKVRRHGQKDHRLIRKDWGLAHGNDEGVGSNAPRKIRAIHVILRQLGAPTSPLEVAFIKIFFPLQPWESP